MSSPSDDGQYTDTDKEEVISKDGISDAEQEPHSLHIPISPGVPVSQGKLGELDKDDVSGKPQEVTAGSSGTASNDDEDEEIRLRRKLLEKRNVAEDAKVGKESTANGTQPVPKKTESRKRVISVSEDEEMFSMQPKDSQIARQRSGNGKGHEEKTKAREKYQPEKNRRDRSREDRHRRHRDRERDRRDVSQSESSLRRFDARDDRNRHQSRIFSKESGRTEVRGATSSRAHEDKLKSRNLRAESHENRTSHSKATKKERSRSPKKRDSLTVDQRSSSREQPPLKKIHVEKYEMTVKQEMVKNKVGEVVKTEKVEEETVMEIDVKEEEVKSDASEMNGKDAEIDEEEPSTSTRDEENALPSKYSKFDSSPEGDENDDDEGELSEREGSLKSDTSESASDESLEQMNSDDEKVDIMDFDEEALAKMSPETRAIIEESQQQKLISQLPAYYPGVSGCRSVAEFECLNRIEEGTFGVVYRAKEKRTDEVVALKRLKMEKEREGFPITSLREINMLLKAGNHPNIVNVREIVVGSNMDKIYLVMDYIEHDMKSLMDFMYARQKHFTIGQIKTLMRQLLSGVEHMHDEWILHRDLKTSNLLLSHKGILKIGDFGLAREFGDPLKPYTPIVVTLWYRSPELLLGIKEYSTSVDMWSCGCIFAEFLKLKPLFPGKGELDQVKKIFLELGTPNERIWPGYSSLPGPRRMRFENHEHNQMRKKFPPNVLDETGFELLNKGLLAYDPKKRLSAREALDHIWFTQEPLPTPPDMFPTWPAKSELGKTVPKSPVSKVTSPKQVRDEKLYRELKVEPPKKEIVGFALKFDPVKF